MVYTGNEYGEHADMTKRPTEKDLLDGLNAHTAHSDELANPLPHELSPLERLKGSVKRYDRPTDPVWDEFFDSDEGVTDDFMENRDQPQHARNDMALVDETAKGHVALKGFFSICREWGCNQDEMMQMLGCVSQSTLADYQSLPYVQLPQDTLERISYILGIYKSLRVMYPTAERANRRVRLRTSEAPFDGMSALDFMAQGSIEHLREARRYFDAKRAG